MYTVFLIPALILYTLATAMFVVDIVAVRGRWTGYAVSMLAAGAVFHSLDLMARGIQAGNVPVADFAQSLSFFAWLTVLVSLVLIVRLNFSVLGGFVAPSALVALSASVVMTRDDTAVLPYALRSAWLPIHVTLAFLGEALLVLAASVSLVYLVQESRVKAKRPLPVIGALPSLEKLDRINYRLLGWGFALLSLAMLSGSIWAEMTWGKFWSWEPRQSWSLVTWILYAALLESRLTVGWRGRRAATLTIIVFSVLVGSYLGVNLMHPGKHGGSFG